MASTSPALTRCIRNPDVVLREEEPDGALLFNPDTNQIRVLNATGAFIWGLCDGTRDQPSLVAALKEEFDGVPPDEVDNQVKEFMDDMQANGFIGFVEE